MTPDFFGINVYCLEGFDLARIPIREAPGINDALTVPRAPNLRIVGGYYALSLGDAPVGLGHAHPLDPPAFCSWGCFLA